jgi:hypothetical protein
VFDHIVSLPAMFLWMGYTGIQFHVYDACIRGRSSSAGASSFASLACGSVAGFAATVATYPLDIIRTICAQHETGACIIPAPRTFLNASYPSKLPCSPPPPHLRSCSSPRLAGDLRTPPTSQGDRELPDVGASESPVPRTARRSHEQRVSALLHSAQAT